MQTGMHLSEVFLFLYCQYHYQTCQISRQQYFEKVTISSLQELWTTSSPQLGVHDAEMKTVVGVLNKITFALSSYNPISGC